MRAERGSRFARILTIARKEITDVVRDRRTIMVTLVTAIAAGPLVLFLVLNMVSRQADQTQQLILPVIGSEHAPAVIAFLQRQQVKITAARTDYEARIRAGDLDVVLEIDANFAADVAKGKAGVVRLHYDRSRDRARVAIEQTEALLRAFGREWGRGRLLLRGVAPEVAFPLQIEAHDLATPQSSGSLLLFLVAYYGLFAAMLGGMAVALDLSAGERERMSLEPLLMTPATPGEIAIGKWIAVVAFDGAVVVLTLAGFYLTLRFAPLPSVGVPFLFGLVEFVRFLVVLVPLVALMPALLLFVGARGRTYKEAQSNLSVLLFLVSMLPLVQLLMQKKEPEWLTYVPISGQYALLARALRGESATPLELLQSCLVPALLTMLALSLVARRWSREAVLAGK